MVTNAIGEWKKYVWVRSHPDLTPPQTQDSSHVAVERVYATVNEHLNTLSVEKLLRDFVKAKGTGTEKPSECT